MAEASIEEMSFETAMAELEQVVTQLERAKTASFDHTLHFAFSRPLIQLASVTPPACITAHSRSTRVKWTAGTWLPR